MRTQSLFYSRFWLGGSGNEIRKNGSDAIVTAIYLATCPGSHMSGIYYCPIPIIADETMISETRVKKVLIILENLNFIKYDHDSKVVWVTTILTQGDWGTINFNAY